MSKNFKLIENWLFYIFLFSIPISARHIFGYQPFGYVEWTAKYIYATDILLAALLVFWSAARIRPRIRAADVFLLAFLGAAFISIGNAMDPGTAWFRFAKLVEFVLLYFYIKDYALKRFDIRKGFTAIVYGGVFQAVIAIPQFMLQSSLGLKWLGESYLTPAMSGIAAFYVNGVKVMRAYGTTPHSNVLAAYLFVAIGAFYNVAIYLKKKWYWHLYHAVMLWAFLLTFSRAILGIWFLTFVVRSLLIRFYKPFHNEFWEKTEEGKRGVIMFVTTAVVGLIFLGVYWPYVTSRASISDTSEAVQMRVFYNHESLVSAHNWFGLGMGNFVPWLMTQDKHLSSDLYQPVHNIYLLIYSETGIIGVSLFLLFLAFLWYGYYRRVGFSKMYHFSFALVVASLLLFGLFDHFLWDIQAGEIIFWTSLGLLAGAK